MAAEQIVLAGGGHSHALLLRRWAMQPNLRPEGLITLVSRASTTLYSGMVPGLIAGYYSRDAAEIDLRQLARKSGVALVVAEIIGIDISRKELLLADRPPISFEILSLDVGAETKSLPNEKEFRDSVDLMPIKPLEPALDWLDQQDKEDFLADNVPFMVVGAGFAGVELALSLRHRWPSRKISLRAYSNQPDKEIRDALSKASILLDSSASDLNGPTLICIGNQAPDWIFSSDLPIDFNGRIRTTNTLQVLEKPFIFAAGDCAINESSPRPPSGVWAVRAAKPLAINIENLAHDLPLSKWKPRKLSLQLLGANQTNKYSIAWAFLGKLKFGPNPILWQLKRFLDLRFVERFSNFNVKRMYSEKDTFNMACRGCASKFPANNLEIALLEAGLKTICNSPEDAVEITETKSNEHFLQSVDGFPALVGDPWLNGRLIAMHACSDLWARGARVVSAQAIVVLPFLKQKIQQELLKQTLLGVQSVLTPQGASLVGGHTFEARSHAPSPPSLGLEVSLSVNGVVDSAKDPWGKQGLKAGDALLISRAIGSGVLFAAAMQDSVNTRYLDAALEKMSEGQYSSFQDLISLNETSYNLPSIHACTDITGFGLLGHLGEMIKATNTSIDNVGTGSQVTISINLESIPILEGAFELLKEGFRSTLAPSNQSSWKLLKSNGADPPLIKLNMGSCFFGSVTYNAMLELLIDPQTCGPLLVSCSPSMAVKLSNKGKWCQIGNVYCA